MNMELNARLIFLPTYFDQISQLYDTLSTNVYSGRWKACIKHDVFKLLQWAPRLKLQWSYLHGVYGILPMHLFGQLSFKSDVNQNIDHWKWVTVYTLRFTPRPSSLTFYPVLCPKLTLMWSAYPYHLVFLIWYPYSLVFLIWYPYALISLYGNTAHCSGCGVAMGCYGLSIVPRTAIVQWYDRYCFAGYARTWARHPTTPWQRECTAITDFQSINSLQAICYTFLRNNLIYIEGRNYSPWVIQ